MIKIYECYLKKIDYILLLISSLLATFFISEKISDYTILNKGQYLIAFMYLLLIFFSLFYLNRKISIKTISSKTNALLIRIGVFLITILLVVSCKDYFFDLKKKAEIYLLATGEKNIKSNSSEVWITNIFIDNQKYELSNLNLSDGWELRDGAIVSYKNQPRSIKLNIQCKNEVKIYFLKHPWSGIVKVVERNRESTVDLFSEKSCDYEYIIKASEIKINPLRLGILFIGLCIILYNLFLFIIAVFLKLKIDLKLFIYSLFISLISFYITTYGKSNMTGKLLCLKFSIIVFVLNYFFIMKKILANKINLLSKKEIVHLIALSNLFSLMMWNYNYYYFDNIISSTKSILFFLLSSIFAFTIIYYFILIINQNSINFIKENMSEHVSKKRILYYALPCIIVWSIYLYGFNPGLMSPDSIDQWIQKSTLNFNDWHPTFHTLYILLLAKIWNSPMIVAIFQILILSFVFAYAMYLLEQNGIKKKILMTISIIYSLFPPNGFMVITLWKDIPYAIFLFLLSIYMYKIYITKGDFLKRYDRVFILSLICVYLYRHNGFVPFFMTFIFLFLIYSKYFKKILLYFIITISIIFMVKGPLYSRLNVKPVPKGIGHSFLMHQICFVVKENGNISKEDIDSINNIVDVEYIKKNYSKYTHDTLAFSGYPYYEKVAQNRNEVMKLYFKVLLKNPKLIIQDWLYLTDLIWDINRPYDGYTSTYVTSSPKEVANYMRISYNFNELKSFNNSVKPLLNNFNNIITKNSFFFSFIWRHGIYLFVVLVLLSLIIQKKDRNVVIVFIPIIFNILSLLISMIAQDYRYIYSTILAFPFLVGVSIIELNK